MAFVNARAFYESVIANSTVEDEVAFATAAIDKLNASNEKRRNRVAERKADEEQYKEMFVGFLSPVPMTASDLLAKFNEAGVIEVNGKALTRQKVSAWGTALVNAGVIDSDKVKLAGNGKGKVVGYTVIG